MSMSEFVLEFIKFLYREQLNIVVVRLRFWVRLEREGVVNREKAETTNVPKMTWRWHSDCQIRDRVFGGETHWGWKALLSHTTKD